jgi:hypothetical protein
MATARLRARRIGVTHFALQVSSVPARRDLQRMDTTFAARRVDVTGLAA